MSNQEFNSLNDFESFVSSTIRPWSQEKRIALAAAMAERWLPIYESFSEEYESDPWATEVAGETWRVGLNDFPDDLMYTLIVNDAVIGKFHDWPACWQR